MIRTLPTPTSRCRFGFARTDITPPVGMYHRMWGAATHDRSTGIHRPLTASALAFAPLGGDATPFLLITLDHCLLWNTDIAAMRRALAAEHRLRPEQFVITFSHTHAAGLMDPSRRDLPGGDLIGPYLEKLTRQMVDLAGQALAGLAPVSISYAGGHSELACHRDAWDEATNQYVCGMNPGGPTDFTLVAARVTDEAGRLRATFVNYSCHPTTLAWENSLISSDFPGAMCETVEKQTGAPCVFLQGASGDVGPRHGYVGDPAIADKNGRELAWSALAALESLGPPNADFHYTGPVISGATLGVWAYQGFTAARRAATAEFALRRVEVPLPYIADRPTLEQLSADRERWIGLENDARRAEDAGRIRDCRAMVERLTRALTRWSSVPPGPEFPYQLTLVRLGDAIWITAEGEPYQFLQTELRRRFPGRTILVNVLADGWRCAYLPTRETYGRNIYQQQVALLAAGSLERVVDAATAAITDLVSE